MTQATAGETRTRTIDADLNYIVDDGVPPVMYVDWPEEEHNAHLPTYEARRTRIHDGRPHRHEFALASHGFAFDEQPSAVADFYDPDEVESVYYPEVAALIAKHIGASDVRVFDHTIRTGDEAIVAEQGVRQPVKAVHNDYTEASAPRRVRDILGEDAAAAALRRRFAIVQVWRPIRVPVACEPLAICDGRTIPSRGFIRMQRRYPYRTAEVYHIAYDPEHLWYYFPAMTPAEALVFKVFDTDAGAGVRFTAHAAFDDPGTAPGARPRESIESRALVLF